MSRISLPFILVTWLALIVAMVTSGNEEGYLVDDSDLVPLFSAVDYFDNPFKYRRYGSSIGIVFGYSYFRAGIERNSGMELIPNDLGKTKTPNWISFASNGTILIGEAAKNQANTNPQSTLFNVIRLLGRKFDDPEVQREIEVSRYKIVNREEKPYAEIKLGSGETKLFSPEEMVSMLLTYVKDMAENHLRKRIWKATIIVPDYVVDYFGKNSLKLVAEEVGFHDVRVLGAQVAAIYACDIDEADEKYYLVFHLSDGVCEVDVFNFDHGLFDPLAQRIDTNLGAKEIDKRVENYFIGLIKNKYGRDIIGELDETARERLVKECERAKIELSSHEQVVLEIESLFEGVNFSETFTRTEFEELNADLFEKAMSLVESALEEAKLKKENIDETILVGGSTRIPKVQMLFKGLFNGKEPSNAFGVNPDEVLPKGALEYLRFQSEYNSVRYVSRHASPLSIGIQTVGGVMTKVIPRHSVHPSLKKALFTTNRDNQSTVEIKVYNGEMRFAKDCREIGRFNLTGIHPAPRGVPRIEITFEVDGSEVLHVKAVDKVSNKFASSARLHTYFGYDSNEEMEIERMLEESVEQEDRMYWLAKSTTK